MIFPPIYQRSPAFVSVYLWILGTKVDKELIDETAERDAAFVKMKDDPNSFPGVVNLKRGEKLCVKHA